MRADSDASFDLVDQPWLLARRDDGTVAELSLRETLRDAHLLLGLVGDVPTQVFALTRMLLAVLHRAIDGPSDLEHWASLWAMGQLPADAIDRYLERHRDRFDLLHPTTPFLQVAALRTTKGEVSELQKLIADVPNGRPFFTTRLARSLSLPYGEAARWLVHCHAFDPSGIKSGAVGDDRVKGGKGYPIGTGWSGAIGGVLAEGPRLRETLLLNLIATNYGDLAQWRDTDAPAWERDPVGPAEEFPGGRPPTGPIDLYTWQSRRIRLVRGHDAIVGVVIANGERTTPQNRQTIEPNTGWRRSEPQEKALKRPLVYMPQEHDPSRAVWRGLQSLLPAVARPQGKDARPRLAPIVLEWVSRVTAEVIGPDYPVRVRTIGMSYLPRPQNSTTGEIVDDMLALRSVLLRSDAHELAGVAVQCARAAEQAARALGHLASNLAAASGGDGEGQHSRAFELGLAALDQRYRTWISELHAESDPTDEQVRWHNEVRRIIARLGADMVAAAPPTAWVGRTVRKHLLTVAHADRKFRFDLHDAVPMATRPEIVKSGASQ